MAFTVVLAASSRSIPATAAMRPTAVPAPPPGAVNAVTLDVRASRNSLSTAPNAPDANDPITSYRWLLNLDNTGDPYAANSKLYCHPSSNLAQGSIPPAGSILGTTYVVTTLGYPQGCEWPSVRYAVASPALSEGTDFDWNISKALPVGGTLGDLTPGLPVNCPTVAEPIKACRYLLTVMSDGYQIGGVHFAVPNPTGIVHVYLNPYPLPLGTIRIKAFDDSYPTDGTYDEGTESGLVGFH